MIDKLIYGGAAAILAALVLALVGLKLSNAHLETQLAEAKIYGTACAMANSELAARVTRQNKAVEEIKAQSDAREKKGQELGRQARAAAGRLYAEADAVRRAKQHGDTCKIANALFSSYLKGQR